MGASDVRSPLTLTSASYRSKCVCIFTYSSINGDAPHQSLGGFLASSICAQLKGSRELHSWLKGRREAAFSMLPRMLLFQPISWLCWFGPLSLLSSLENMEYVRLKPKPISLEGHTLFCSVWNMTHRQANWGDGKVSLVDTDSLPYSQWCCGSMSRHMNHLQESPVPCETRYSESSPLPFVVTTTIALLYQNE